ncbi:MAG: hypothetical protein A2784_04170 [Candidatus Chisholmbacteria bacterium RIFCSPHIGHO2_01_FULL_48_12]|uniref:Cupin type-2 domain-containing protein n=2 Tax=Patescibacteria group TaxID=1783273 RepID=A0A1G1VNP6_9BACT|nr:MAG: hypothetical protein A2784_04170 [Candidatus Chisholmbacteria bacterium RIFCSPHIGHO2_01_FULL_48_12]OGZ40462.1 MAG: hypothetical protein A3I20_01720 [Candidatus Portnoybacteria bacterium RIFCSPLOWO2_02_FULL_40_15]
MVQKQRLIPISQDERGQIVKILEGKITSVLVIPSRKGAIRANHYHKKDTHYVYMISGKMRYTVKDLSKKRARKQWVILNPGDLVYTPAMTAHAMEFLEDSVFLALTTQKRDQKNYENDTVRITLV